MRVISGKARGTILKTPTGLSTRPTADRVKEALFSIIQFDLPNASVLDLFGGSGQLGIEALSRGARYATFVDLQDTSCKLIRENLQRTHFSDCASVIKSDYVAFLKSTGERFNIVFLDPPYAEKFLENSLKLITEIDILQSNGIIITERPLGKELNLEFSGYNRSKDYKYGNTLLAFYRKCGEGVL